MFHEFIVSSGVKSVSSSELLPSFAEGQLEGHSTVKRWAINSKLGKKKTAQRQWLDKLLVSRLFSQVRFNGRLVYKAAVENNLK